MLGNCCFLGKLVLMLSMVFLGMLLFFVDVAVVRDAGDVVGDDNNGVVGDVCHAGILTILVMFGMLVMLGILLMLVMLATLVMLVKYVMLICWWCWRC